MATSIALAGNPNSGKTTMFNDLTGSTQHVGNWPGVTVEKKEGRLKSAPEVLIQDLPGIYSLSPYTLEEVVSRNYLIQEKPNAILNIVDASNLERNLYLTTQLLELGIPVVVALNMMDVVRKNGDTINVAKLSKSLGCQVVETSALRGEGSQKAIETAISAATSNQTPPPLNVFSGTVEHVIAHIEDLVKGYIPTEQQRFFAIKLFERDEKILEQVKLPQDVLNQLEKIISDCEDELDDDSESIITNERYAYISRVITTSLHRKRAPGSLTASDKIDRVVTNRWLALPIFVAVIFLVYFLAVSSGGIGTHLTDWANDGLFGDGWHLFGNGASEYEEVADKYYQNSLLIDTYLTAANNAGIDTEPVREALSAEEEDPANDAIVAGFIEQAQAQNLTAISEDEGTKGQTIDAATFETALAVEEPDPANYGTWVPGLPTLATQGLESIGVADWLQSLVVDGIIGGVGAVLGFLPQMIVLFILLAFLEDVGYMARIAFIMDRIFRRFGLSGKSFIPILIGAGCSVPGIMASRTIEQERDRRMTIVVTSFMPCSAKLPIIALITGAIFGGAWWVAPIAYFIGFAAIIISGIILKKIKSFAGNPAPFVMELPAYRWPALKNVVRSTWDRTAAFLKKAGTIILLASISVWFATNFGFKNGSFGMVPMEESLMAAIGGFIAPIFAPLGFGNWQSTVATLLGLVAKEEVVGVFGVFFGVSGDALAMVEGGAFSHLSAIASHFTMLTAFSFLIFNLLCSPCFAAIGAIRREMNSGKWTWFAILYQTIFAYIISLIVYQLGMLFTAGIFGVGTIAAFLCLAFLLFMLFRPAKKELAQA